MEAPLINTPDARFRLSRNSEMRLSSFGGPRVYELGLSVGKIERAIPSPFFFRARVDDASFASALGGVVLVWFSFCFGYLRMIKEEGAAAAAAACGV